MNNIGDCLLSAYDKRKRRGLPKSAGDKIIDDKKTKAILMNFLDTEVITELEDGTQVTATTREMIVGSAIKDAIEKGNIDKLQKFMVVQGEIDENANNQVNISLVDKDLEQRALGNKENDTSR